MRYLQLWGNLLKVNHGKLKKFPSIETVTTRNLLEFRILIISFAISMIKSFILPFFSGRK